jgi:hypothetical protein
MSRPFVLIASSRKGSHVLLTALQKHPEVLVHDQPLSKPTYMPGLDGEELAAHFFDRPDPVAILALSWDAARCRHRGFWDELRRRKVGVIFLHRRNMLQWYVSVQIAKNTDLWIAHTDPGSSGQPEPKHLYINPETAEWTIDNDWLSERVAHRFFASHLSQHVWYESLVAHYSRHMAMVQKFLGVIPLTLTPNCYKQQLRPLSSTIANYQDLLRIWAGTPMELMLRENLPPQVMPEIVP